LVVNSAEALALIASTFRHAAATGELIIPSDDRKLAETVLDLADQYKTREERYGIAAVCETLASGRAITGEEADELMAQADTVFKPSN
jgi:predicted nucleic-acid-binding protein